MDDQIAGRLRYELGAEDSIRSPFGLDDDRGGAYLSFQSGFARSEEQHVDQGSESASGERSGDKYPTDAFIKAPSV